VLPNFGGSPVFMPTPFDADSQSDQIWHGDTYWDGRVFRRSAMPLHLQKCVARFVSDSCFFVRVASGVDFDPWPHRWAPEVSLGETSTFSLRLWCRPASGFYHDKADF